MVTANHNSVQEIPFVMMRRISHREAHSREGSTLTRHIKNANIITRAIKDFVFIFCLQFSG